MDKEYIKRLAEDPKFIPGIYNYCDRWCERCPLNSRCLNFVLSEEQFEDPQARDIKNDTFWQKLHEVFQVTLEMVKETAKEQGIDLDSLDLHAAVEENKKINDIAKNHGCAHAAKTYAEMVKNWFDSSKDLFEEKADDLSLKARLELPDSDLDSISKQAWLIAIRMTQCDIRNTNEIRFTNNYGARKKSVSQEGASLP